MADRAAVAALVAGGGWVHGAGAEEGGRGAAEAAGGRYVVLPAFPSKLAAPRKVVVWLPAGYDTTAERHAVLYMHDGQNLFDSATAMGGKPWAVDARLAPLIADGLVRPTIIVGIWSGRERAREFAPAAALEALTPESRLALLGEPPGRGVSASRAAVGDVAEAEREAEAAPALTDAYLRFIVEELKPAIDSQFRTHRDRRNTFIMGSSLGGVVSLYAVARHPEVFAGAGCLSTHWPITVNFNMLYDKDDMRPVRIASAYFDWLSRKLPRAGGHKLYFDHGDSGLDALYPPYQAQVNALLRAKGYRDGIDCIVKAYPGDGHTEAAWGGRVDIPLRFLLAK
ncbi:alpha/beta hydrolase [Pseudoduganella namucuonensis]|nr:alpha/beta hydrolase-fold protein [Pseudoduganella namucuonensis]